jgi:hypothetical protein
VQNPHTTEPAGDPPAGVAFPLRSLDALQFDAETASDICDPPSTLMFRPTASKDPALFELIELLSPTPGRPATG